MNDPVILVLIIALVVAVAVAAWMYTQKRRTETLRDQFGPEYEHAVQEHGDRKTAEEALKERTERVEHLKLRPLASREREQFAERWRLVQAQFVDDPTGATKEADGLVGEAMRTRGYPVGDFDQRAGDVSVDHPHVVENYRAAHEIALRNERGEAETEDLRKAMVHYRALFEELLEARTDERTEVRR